MKKLQTIISKSLTISMLIACSFPALAQQVVYKKSPVTSKNLFRLILVSERNTRRPSIGTLVSFTRSGTLREVRETKPFDISSRKVVKCNKDHPSGPLYILSLIAKDFNHTFTLPVATCKAFQDCLEVIDETESIDVKLSDDLGSIDEIAFPKRCQPLD